MPPTKMNEISEGQWRAKALIKDIEGSRSYIVNLNFNVKRGEAARMDVTTTLGTGVASLLVDKNEVRYVLFEAKKLYYGVPQAGVMRPILSVPFDPRWINNVLLDLPIEEKGWTCVRDNGGFLQQCENSASGLKVTWSGRLGAKRKPF